MDDNNEASHQAKQKMLEAIQKLKDAGSLIRSVNKMGEIPLKSTRMNWIILIILMICFLLLGGVAGLLLTS
jgi:hypothetical protein